MSKSEPGCHSSESSRWTARVVHGGPGPMPTSGTGGAEDFSSGDPLSEVEVAEGLGSSRQSGKRWAAGRIGLVGADTWPRHHRGATDSRRHRRYELREAMELAARKVARLGVPAAELDRLQRLVDDIQAYANGAVYASRP